MPDPLERAIRPRRAYTLGTTGERGTTMNLGPVELLVILAIVLLLFGSKKLPDLAKSLGKSTKEFKKGMRDSDDEEEDATPVKKTQDKSDS
jgi:sec-independent protein translocase protein TatA